jgi:hypothetical protein
MSFSDELEKIAALVTAAEDEIILAAMFHETWKPAAFDVDLRVRMGTSYATHSFNIVRLALRREMILALMRIWDSNKDAVRMTAIAAKLKEDDFFRDLVSYRAARLGMSSKFVEPALTRSLEPKREAILSLVQKYGEGGLGFETFTKIRALRNQQLAHRQVKSASTAIADPEDNEVENFYRDSLDVVTHLLSLVLAKAFDLNEVADVYRHHAGFFWINARGERTEGHPNYKPSR